MPERPESPHVLQLKAELKQLLEDRKQARRTPKDNPSPAHARELRKIKQEIDGTRKGIRASRMRDRRKREKLDGTAQRRKREAKQRQREQDKLYLEEEAEIYTISETFVAYHALTAKRLLACYTCLNRLEVGDRVYRFHERLFTIHPEASFIHVSCSVPHHLIHNDRVNRREPWAFALDEHQEDVMRVFTELERKRRAEQKPVEYVKVDNLQRMREGRSRVVG